MESVKGFISSIIKSAIDILLLMIVRLRAYFAPTPRNRHNFVVVNTTLYVDDNCPGYKVNVELFGVTHWRDIYDAVHQQYSDLNLDELPEARLDVQYEVLGEKYHIVYKQDVSPRIVYPPYTIDDLRDYLNSSRVLLPIMHAERNNVDITDLVVQYAGPKGNFYIDNVDIVVRGEWISSNSSDKNCDITLMDGECKEYLFSSKSNMGLLNMFNINNIARDDTVINRNNVFKSLSSETDSDEDALASEGEASEGEASEGEDALASEGEDASAGEDGESSTSSEEVPPPIHESRTASSSSMEEQEEEEFIIIDIT